MDFKEWWHSVGSGIRPAISSDMEKHAEFVANVAWNAAQQNTKVAEQTPTNSAMVPCPAHDPGFTCQIRLAGRCEIRPCLVQVQHQ
jgi:hypothetical protein